MKKKILMFTLAASTALTGCTIGNKEDINQPALVEESDASDVVAEKDNWLSDLDTIDLNGESIDSSIFKENELTLVNVWASWCPPCIAEIPDLAKLDKEYENVGIKGLVVEHEKNGMFMEIGLGLSIEEKKIVEDILEKSKAEYGQILVSEDMKHGPLATVAEFPTSYFVDSDGNFVGEPVKGAKSIDQWRFIIEERLDMVQND